MAASLWTWTEWAAGRGEPGWASLRGRAAEAPGQGVLARALEAPALRGPQLRRRHVRTRAQIGENLCVHLRGKTARVHPQSAQKESQRPRLRTTVVRHV